ncbi:MAG: DUF3861 domain-containing protein [Muribaculaceae bacterium]|nr:DUF3861 domain-containing protein [Muribaculaceae bacterium]
MEKEKKSYFFNVVEAKDGKISEVMNFEFGGHHDLAALVEKAKASGMFSKDKYAKEFVVGMRLLHHAIKKNIEQPLFAEFAPKFKEFKEQVKGKCGCDSGCGCK